MSIKDQNNAKKQKILIFSTENSCRTQMAEGWMKYYTGSLAEVYSAGLCPRELDIFAAHIMMEAVIDITQQKAKPFSEFDGQEFHRVIVFPDADKKVPDIAFPGDTHIACIQIGPYDKEEEKKIVYRIARDEIENFCFEFVHQYVRKLI